MANTNAPRQVVYYSESGSQPLTAAAGLPWTDVILSFLVPTSASDLTLIGKGAAFPTPSSIDVQTVQALQAAGKNVLVSFGGTTMPSSAYQAYAKDVSALVDQLILQWVEPFGLDGIDLDYEDDTGFTGTYDGIGFLVALTQGLVKAKPGLIVTHAPQTPYWDPQWNGGPYQQVWAQADSEIAWINNQFYGNPSYDATAALKVQWYETIARITSPAKLLLGAPLAESAGEGYLPVSELVGDVIDPLQQVFGAAIGGFMGWEFAVDEGDAFAKAVGRALGLPGSRTLRERR